MGNKLHVGRLDYQVTSEDLRQLFADAGQVLSAEVIMDRDTHRSKGFAFVEMVDQPTAQKAIELYNGFMLRDHAIVVSEARPPEARGNSGQSGRTMSQSHQPNYRQVAHKSRGGAKRRF